MLINKETIPYRMGLQPFYYYQSSPPVKNERLGAYHPITPPYHHPYDFVLPMQSPQSSVAAEALAAVAAAAGLPLPAGSSPRSTGSVSSSVSSSSSSSSSGSPLYFYMNGRGAGSDGAEDISSVPLSPPHTPPLRDAVSPIVRSRSNGPLMAASQYGSISSLSGTSEPSLTSAASGTARNSVIMKVQNQQVVPMERDADAGSPSEPETVEEFICRWENCYCVFFKLEDLASHVTQKHAVIGLDGLYYCRWERCLRQDRGFNARYKMLVHVRTHTKEKPHQCGKCGKCFSRAENLKIHLRSHSGEKPYVCPVEGCHKAYSNSSDRFKHTRTHSNDKPYVCKVAGCNKRYTDPSSLRKHVKTFKHPSQGRPALADAYCMEYESYSQDSTRSDATGSNPSDAHVDDFDPDDIGELIDVVNIDGAYEWCDRIGGEPCGHPDCGTDGNERVRMHTEQSDEQPDEQPDEQSDEQSDEQPDEQPDEQTGLDAATDAAEEQRPAVYVTTAEAWPMPAVLNKIPPDNAAAGATGETRAPQADGGDDGATKAQAIEDDELCSAIRQLNGRPKAARMLRMDVDGPLDLSMHHR